MAQAKRLAARRARDAAEAEAGALPSGGARPSFPVGRHWLRTELLSHLLPGYCLDPDAAMMDAAKRLGLGPVPLFDPAWYRARHGIGDADPFTHYVEQGAAQDLDPHPLFSVPYYRQQAPEAGANPLQHFLTLGGPAGLDCHPLFFSAWYWDRYPDVKTADIIPIVHYLQYGVHEGRDPNPLFSTRFYQSQNPAGPNAANPLAHYVLGGESAGLRPHPSFDPGAVMQAFKPAAQSGPLQAYLEVVGRAQAVRAGSVPENQPEPGITPTPLPRIARAPGAAIADGIALLQGLCTPPADPAGRAAYQLAKLSAIPADPALPGELAAAMLAGPHDPALLLEAAGILPARVPALPPAGPDGILSRYSTLQFALAGQFRLDPARAGTASSAGPLISILMPVYRPPLHILERAILSVVCQTYPNWQLCLADDGSRQPGLSALLARFAADKRIKLATLSRNGGIAAATNRALALATGEYVGLLDNDDMLAAGALEAVAAHLQQHPDTGLIYTDECMIDVDDVPDRLFTKPDWSPLLLTSMMFTGHFSVYRTALLRQAGAFRSKFDFSQDYDLVLRVAELDPVVAHLREVLYGWRMLPGSGAADGKPEARRSNIAALQAAMDRRGWGGSAIALPQANRALRPPPEPHPLVSIVLPSDNPDHIVQSVLSVAAHTTYDKYEIVVVANAAAIASCKQRLNHGRVRFVRYDRPFNFSAKCNEGAKAARGGYLIFFNDDVRVLTPGWIEAILECLTIDGVGAAAPKLLYEDHTIQHAGMVTGTRRLVGTAFHSFPARTGAHFNLAQCVREVSLLSGACLTVAATTFARLDGFDALNTPIAHSDVDFCLRLRESGLSCIYTPHAELTHIGHASIGAARAARPFRQDKADLYLMRRFGPALQEDPFFPPTMHELLAIGDQYPYRYHAAARAKGPPPLHDALLISHDLSGSGAPKIVFDMARTLIGAGWQVVVMSPCDGPYRERLLAAGADVIIEPMALEPSGAVIDLARNFDVVIGNTVLSWRLAPALSGFTRVFLYAHETALVEELHASQPDFAGALRLAACVWAGSGRAAAPLQRIGAEPVVLEYGVETPASSPKSGPPSGAITVAVLATIEPRKGQDLAVKAFPLLPPELRACCWLRVNGRVNDPGFAQAIQDIAAPEPRIVIGPELGLDGYRQALAAADIILCPSRDDTLPLVSLNALAEGKVLICSAEVGTAAYLTDGVSGFILSANHPDEIAAVLARAIAARERWPEIGAAAQAVFQNNFSEARFERRLLALLDAALPEARAAE